MYILRAIIHTEKKCKRKRSKQKWQTSMKTFAFSLAFYSLICFYLDLYYVLMEVTVTPFLGFLVLRSRPTSWKAQQWNFIRLTELENFTPIVGFLSYKTISYNSCVCVCENLECVVFIVTYRCLTGPRSISNLSVGSRFVHCTMKSCARSLHPCSCIGITTSQNIVMRRKCSSCSVSDNPSSVESSNGDLQTRQISSEFYILNWLRFFSSKKINHYHVQCFYCDFQFKFTSCYFISILDGSHVDLADES